MGRNNPPYYLSAYSLALKQGFEGTLDEWLDSLIGPPGPSGRSAYEYAKAGGYAGTEAEFTAQMARELTIIQATEAMNAHMEDQNNPHNTTAESIGAAPKDHKHDAASVGAAPKDHKHDAASVGAPGISEVFSLVNLGTAIPQNANMDTYRAPGSYYCEAGTIAATITNAPFKDFGFRMIVFKGYSNRIHQMAMGNSNEIKLRTYTGTAWVDDWGSTQQPALKSLLAEDYMVMSSYQIMNSVDDIPADAPIGSLFLVPMED